MLKYLGIKDGFEIKISKVELTDVVDGDWVDTLIKDGVLEEIY